MPGLDILQNFSGFAPLTVVLALAAAIAFATAAFTGSQALSRRSQIRRRITHFDGAQNAAHRASESRRTAEAIAEKATRHFGAAVASDQLKLLRQRLVRAGWFDARAIGVFFLARITLALAAAPAAFFAVPLILPDLPTALAWSATGLAGLLGYQAPSFYLDKRVKQNRMEAEDGFPDFLDLMVVCADSGLSMEAALERVSRELAETYPSLAMNLTLTSLEIRAGHTLGMALDNLAERLDMDEAHSFATLLQQSEELGSSLTEALRVYSDDMRHKRLSRAEEKAYSLPAKLSIPLTLCIFPVVMIIALLPVIVRLKTGMF